MRPRKRNLILNKTYRWRRQPPADLSPEERALRKARSIAEKAGIACTVVFLILAYRMVSLTGIAHTIVYTVVAVAAVVLMLWFRQAVMECGDVSGIRRLMLIPAIIVLVSGGLRVIYEVKLPGYRVSMPAEDDFTMTFYTYEGRYSQYGDGYCLEPKDIYTIDGQKYDEGSPVRIHPATGSTLEASYSGYYSKHRGKDGTEQHFEASAARTIAFTPEDFRDGEYKVHLSASDPLRGVTVDMYFVFTRYCPFWAVLFS